MISTIYPVTLFSLLRPLSRQVYLGGIDFPTVHGFGSTVSGHFRFNVGCWG